jgi:ureidoacrylate peracid hydrolase
VQNTFSEKHVDDGATAAFDPARTAVVVVDMLNDFFKPGGAMVLSGGEALYEPHRRLLAAARAAGMPVLWLNQTLLPDDSLFRKRVVHCIQGTWGCQVVDDLPIAPGDLVIPKRRYSSFFQTTLDLTLRERDIRTVIVTGVVTNICVRSTVHDAFFLGYHVIVPEDCVMATSEAAQEVTLYDIANHYGDVTRLDALLPIIGRGA